MFEKSKQKIQTTVIEPIKNALTVAILAFATALLALCVAVFG